MLSALGLEEQFEGQERSESLTLRRKLEKQDIRIQCSETECGRHHAVLAMLIRQISLRVCYLFIIFSSFSVL